MRGFRQFGSAALALIVAAGVRDASALMLCGQKARATGAPREGSTLRLRTACRANEVAVDPSQLGASTGVETMHFSSETVLRGTATLFLTTNGRINSDEYEARTPIGAGTLRELRCYLPDPSGGDGITLTVGVGACDGPLAYGTGPTLSFAGTEAQVAKEASGPVATVAAGQCVALRVQLLGTTTSTYVNCSLERVPS